MDHRQLESIGEQLRSLGHQRREVVQRIVSDADKGSTDHAKQLYQDLDRISESAMALMAQQRELIADQLHT